MKKVLFCLLFLLACNPDPPAQHVVTDQGKVRINGKDCEVVFVDRPEAGGLWFIDCGPGSSAVQYQSGKQHVSVGQYSPPAPVPSATTFSGLNCKVTAVTDAGMTFDCKNESK